MFHVDNFSTVAMEIFKKQTTFKVLKEIANLPA